MPIEKTTGLGLSFQDKTFAITCASLVATYVGFAITSRRQLKKSLKESSEMYEETSTKIAEAMETVKHRQS
jgi:hypothetical protein